MSALSFARQAFGREKPHSSITDWVDILTSISIGEEVYDGIPELVDSINLQASGPAEASRALRKKLKHGNSHQQYRSLVLLKALVENGGQKFASTFADGHMTDALRSIATDAHADRRMKKKLTLVLAFWRDQYKDDPSMSVVASLYRQCFGSGRAIGSKEMADFIGVDFEEEKENKRKQQKREAKEKAKILAREKRELEAKQLTGDKRPKRPPFNFETEKPKVLTSIVEGSQASNNLQNAIQLVNLETDKLETNERVQECLEKAKQARRPVVRYIQLVENEELIGTLIETNDRIVSALDMYNHLFAASNAKAENTSDVTSNLASMSINPPAGETTRNKGKGRHPVEVPPDAYQDLQDINFGSLGASTNNLPPPMRPSALSDDGYEEENADHRVTLSDYSDYDSSSEETNKNKAGSPSKRNYVTVSDDEDDASGLTSSTKKQGQDDPFADPFADK